MSDLKHRTVDELRAEVQSLAEHRAKLESDWVAAEQRIETIKQEITSKRQRHHNLGQREAWARIYLAQKT